MRVSGSATGNRIAPGKKAGKRRGGAAFSIEQAPANTASQHSNEVHCVGNVEALLALQAVPDSTQKRSRAIKRADDMLDLLEDIRMGLLNGQVMEDRLVRLARLTAGEHGMIDNSGLSDVLEGIELRAKVELAKLGR